MYQQREFPYVAAWLGWCEALLTSLANDNAAGIHYASCNGGIDFWCPLYHRCSVSTGHSSERYIVLQCDRSALEQIASGSCASSSDLLALLVSLINTELV